MKSNRPGGLVEGLIFAVIVFLGVSTLMFLGIAFMSNDPHLIHRNFAAAIGTAGSMYILIGVLDKRSKPRAEDQVEAIQTICKSRQG